MGLSKYRAKRHLGAGTPEPRGGKSNKNVRHFVVQKHDASHLHFDFRLEFDGVLKSWAVPKGSPHEHGEKRLAVHVEDHPLDYRKFHGTIPKGQYGAGTVEIWDSGNYTVRDAKTGREIEAEMMRRYKKGELEFELHGKKMRGTYLLINMRTGKIKNGWLMMKKDDAYAHENTPTTERKIHGKHSRQLHGIHPMLAKATEEPFNKEGWIFEIKWDGFRAIAEVYNKKVKLYSRSQLPFEEMFPDVVEDLSRIHDDVVLDGEIVVLDKKGRSHFQLLQDYRQTGTGQTIYQVFDILYANGEDLRGLPLLARKAKLKQLLPKLRHVRYSDHVMKKGVSFFRAAKKSGLEGMIAKRSDGKYLTGTRSADWLKVKTHEEQEAVVGGYTEPRGSRKNIGALILGVYKKGELHYIGHTGGGSNTKMLEELKRKLAPLEQEESPFVKTPKPNAPVHWVKPKLVVQVKFQEWTSDGIMRQPILLGLRIDKKPGEVIKETALLQKPPKDEPGDFTNQDKIFWPKEKITKGDVLEYYQKIAPYILPVLKNRPMSLHRFPNGIDGESFFQKDVHDAPDFVKTIGLHSDQENKTVHYLICNDKRTLEYLVQLASIEMHPWNSQTDALNYPDYLVIDLDPENNTPFAIVIKVAQTAKKILDRIGARGYCKTSGSAGLHVYIPLEAKYDYEQTRLFARLICELIHEELPNDTVLSRGAHTRGRKVHLDYPQNRRGATTVAAYSLRPKPGATVSTPLKWSEVKPGLNPKKFTIDTVPKRLKKVGNLWKPVLGKGIDLKKCLKKIALLQTLASKPRAM